MLNLRSKSDRKRELAAQLRLAATIERATALRLRAEFNRVAAAAAAAFKAGKSPVADAIMDPHKRNLERIISGCQRLAITSSARRLFDAAGKALPGMRLERKATETEIERITLEYVDEYAAVKVRQVSDTTRARIANAVQRGLDKESGVAEVARGIANSTGGSIGTARALTIARTETHGAAQTAAVRAADSLGLQGMKKEWVAAEDQRTRPDHVHVNGLAIKMDDQFRVGDAWLLYPGDPSADAPEQTINCRCATIFQTSQE